LDTEGAVESTDSIDTAASGPGWLAASTDVAIVSSMLTEGSPLARGRAANKLFRLNTAGIIVVICWLVCIKYTLNASCEWSSGEEGP